MAAQPHSQKQQQQQQPLLYMQPGGQALAYPQVSAFSRVCPSNVDLVMPACLPANPPCTRERLLGPPFSHVRLSIHPEPGSGCLVRVPRPFFAAPAMAILFY